MRVDKIPDDAVLVEGTIEDYVDPRGNIYTYNRRNNQPAYPYMKEKQEIFGYWYAPVNYITGRKTQRLHRIVAKAFIPNPDNLPIVMHKDNNKKNNCVENLMWGTIAENTKTAYRDGLAVNAKGEEDSQSIPCDMYDTATNRLLRSFGSAHDAATYSGICISTICRQIKNPEKDIRKKIYFTRRGEGSRDHSVIAKVDTRSGKVLCTYANCRIAGDANGLSDSAVNSCVLKGKKPRRHNILFYFKRVYLKGEEIIEIQRESRVGAA